MQNNLKNLTMTLRRRQKERLRECQGKLNGTAKIHKVPENGNIDQLPIYCTKF